MLRQPRSTDISRIRRTIKHDEPATGNQGLPDLRKDGLRIGPFMIGVVDEHFIHLLPSQIHVRRAAVYDTDVALILQNRSEPEKCQRQSANVLGENAATLSGWRGKFQCKIS